MSRNTDLLTGCRITEVQLVKQDGKIVANIFGRWFGGEVENILYNHVMEGSLSECMKQFYKELLIPPESFHLTDIGAYWKFNE